MDINRLIIQWGTFPETSGYNNTNTFPIAFPNKYILALSNEDSKYALPYYVAWINNETKSLTNFGAGCGNDVAYTAGYFVNAIFIGY